MARWRWAWERSTCSTMGSCSGGRWCSVANSSNTSKAVSWSEKKKLLGNGGPSASAVGEASGEPVEEVRETTGALARRSWGIVLEEIMWYRKDSTVRSQESHMECWWVEGSLG